MLDVLISELNNLDEEQIDFQTAMSYRPQNLDEGNFKVVNMCTKQHQLNKPN